MKPNYLASLNRAIDQLLTSVLLTPTPKKKAALGLMMAAKETLKNGKSDRATKSDLIACINLGLHVLPEEELLKIWLQQCQAIGRIEQQNETQEAA